MIRRRIKPVYAIAFLILFYTVGVIGLVLPSYHDLFINLTPLSLLLSLVILLLYQQDWSGRLFLYSIMVFIVGFSVEAIGVATGLIFGEYLYGGVLGVKVFNTPLMIGVNWLLLTYTTWDLVGRSKAPVLFRTILAAILMVVFDIFLEPVAMKMGMWSWSGEQVPLKNYIAWFIISWIFFSLAALLKIKVRNPISVPLWIVLLTFFILLNLFNI